MAKTVMRVLLVVSGLFFCCSFGQQTGQLQQDTDKKDDRFSIGLLPSSYTQKFGSDDGKTKADYNQERSGYSYSLSSSTHKSDKVEDKASSEHKPTTSASSSLSSNQRNSDSGSNNYYSPPSPPYGFSPYNPLYSSPFFNPYRYSPFFGPNLAVAATHGNPQSANQQTASSSNSQVQQPAMPHHSGQLPYLGHYNPYQQLYSALYNYAVQRYGQPYNGGGGLYGSASAINPIAAAPPVYGPYSGGYNPYSGYQTPQNYLSPEAINAFRSIYSSPSENYLSYLNPFSSGISSPFSSSFGGIRSPLSGFSGLGSVGLSGLSRLFG